VRPPRARSTGVSAHPTAAQHAALRCWAQARRADTAALEALLPALLQGDTGAEPGLGPHNHLQVGAPAEGRPSEGCVKGRQRECAGAAFPPAAPSHWPGGAAAAARGGVAVAAAGRPRQAVLIVWRGPGHCPEVGGAGEGLGPPAPCLRPLACEAVRGRGCPAGSCLGDPTGASDRAPPPAAHPPSAAGRRRRARTWRRAGGCLAFCRASSSKASSRRMGTALGLAQRRRRRAAGGGRLRSLLQNPPPGAATRPRLAARGRAAGAMARERLARGWTSRGGRCWRRCDGRAAAWTRRTRRTRRRWTPWRWVPSGDGAAGGRRPRLGEASAAAPGAPLPLASQQTDAPLPCTPLLQAEERAACRVQLRRQRLDISWRRVFGVDLAQLQVGCHASRVCAGTPPVARTAAQTSWGGCT
jgi:hypothetical protein